MLQGPEGLPAGLFLYRCVAEKFKVPATRLTLVLAVPSAQLIVTVWVSEASESVNLPVRVGCPLSFIAVELSARLVIAGGVLTVNWNVDVTEPSSLSVTVTVAV